MLTIGAWLDTNTFVFQKGRHFEQMQLNGLAQTLHMHFEKVFVGNWKNAFQNHGNQKNNNEKLKLTKTVTMP